MNIWLALSAVAMLLTACTHSWLGEKRLITPILAIDHPIMQRLLIRQVLRGAWHLTTIFMLICAVIVVWPQMPDATVILIGGAWLMVGILDGIWTRGAHIGWSMLTASGVLALLGVWL
jgi:hypothetical protein